MTYNDKFDPDLQVDLEERISALVFDTVSSETRGDGQITEEASNDLGKQILQIIVQKLRPDLIAPTYIISDGNAIETTDDWEEVIRNAETWYEYIADCPEAYWLGNPDDIPINQGYGDIAEGNIEALNRHIRAFEERLAELQGGIHNNYNLTVRVEEEESE